MPIIDLTTGHQIDGVLKRGPIGKTYSLALSRLSPVSVAAIRHALDAMILDDTNHTAGWMPGKDWRGTAFQELYDTAAKSDPKLAAMMFGIFVWEAFERHPSDWVTGRFEIDGKPIGSRTYFLKTGATSLDDGI